MTRYWCEFAWLPPGEVHADVLITSHDSHIDAVDVGVTEQPPDATRLAGLTLPGLANVHSHAFHRALRGRTQTQRETPGSFWTWRERMYEVADRLDPDGYFALARAAYAEMVLAGVTCVGEFHYLHHDPAGRPYVEPNVMGEALIAAAREAGLRIALLDTCYLAGGIGQPLAGTQLRFGDGDADRWAERVESLADAYDDPADVVIGAAIHSVRAVPRGQLSTVAAWPTQHSAPLHVHLSEQPKENDDCQATYGVSPTRLLHRHDVLGPRTTAIHATHLLPDDIDVLSETGTTIGVCPTTERDLGDGIGPAKTLWEYGCPLASGSDSHAIVDPFEEVRALELDERLRSRTRGHWSAAELLRIATENGHAALGFAEGGVLAPGAWADLVSVRLDSVRTAGGTPASDTVVFAATAADVHHVVAAGREVAVDGRHVRLGDIGAELGKVIG